MRRVLIISADMGAGHDTAGRVLADAVRQEWPDVEIRWLDTLRVMGRGVGPVFRWIYVTNVQRTPWLYEFFYGSLWRRPWFAEASKRFVGAWCGRRLIRPVAAAAPDLVLSTYPLGTAGMEWLRRQGRLAVPVGAWVTDFAPHPFWVYGSIDLNLVMHPASVAAARRVVPDAPVDVSAPPVDSAFRPGDRDTARAALGLPADAFVPLVSCGAFGFGDVESATAELLAADPSVAPVVVCGRNAALRERMERLAHREPRVRVLGWTDRIPDLTVAADVVVTNAGGLTSLEALATGTPVLMYRPIAAHGRANADLMAQTGLAVVCEVPGSLTATVRGLLADHDRLYELSRTASGYATGNGGGDLAGLLRRLADTLVPAPVPPDRPVPESVPSDRPGRRAGRDRRPGVRPLRAEDALFAYIDTPETPQQLGAVLVFDPKPDGSAVTRADVAYLLDAAPGVGQRLRGGGAWRTPSWVTRPDSAPIITERQVAAESDPQTGLLRAMDEFFSSGVDAGHTVCEGRLVTGLGGGRSALIIKIHHAAADGIAVINDLVGRAMGRPVPAPSERPAAARPMSEPGPVRPGSTPAGRPGSARTAPERPKVSPRRSLASLSTLARGFWTLARAGRAPRSGLPTSVTSASRHHSVLTLPASELRSAARRAGCRTAELVFALLGAALHDVLGEHAGDRVRVLTPVSMRTAESYRNPGNHTGAATVDLPLGAMPLLTRIERTREVLRRQFTSGAPAAGHLVVRAMGLLPPWAHRRLVRMTYRGTWFSAIASVLPGPRSPVALHGARVSVVYPVMPLAPDVGLAVGAMFWGDRFTVCVTTEQAHAALADGLTAAVDTALAKLRVELGEPGRPG